VPIRVSIQRLAPHQLPHPIPLILPAVSHLASSSLYGCVAHCPSVQAFPAVDSPSARSWSSDRRNLASLEQSDLTSLTAAATRIRSVTWIAAEDKAHLTRKSGNLSAALLVKRYLKLVIGLVLPPKKLSPSHWKQDDVECTIRYNPGYNNIRLFSKISASAVLVVMVNHKREFVSTSSL
jgi:hypothetical protein